MHQQRSLVRAEPRTVAEARRAVEDSRARMSNTLDEIEERLVSKKQQISARMDVMRPVKTRIRSRPFMTMALALGAGVLLWKLRHKKEEPEPESGLLARLLRKD